MNNLEKLLLESNEVLRSAYQIAARNGVDTNWDSFVNRVSVCLANQHKLTNKLRKQAANDNEKTQKLRLLRKTLMYIFKEIIGALTIIPIGFLYASWHNKPKIIKLINSWSIFLSGKPLYHENGTPIN